MEFKEESQTENAERYFQTANQLKQEGKLEEAIDVYRRAIELNPKNFHFYYNLGVVFETQNKMDLAIDNYNIAIELNSKFVWSYINLGNALIRQGLPEKALEVFYFVRDNLEYNPNLLMQISELDIKINYTDAKTVENLYIFFLKTLNKEQKSLIKKILIDAKTKTTQKNNFDFSNTLFCIVSLLYLDVNNNLFNKLFLLIDNALYEANKIDSNLSKVLDKLGEYIVKEQQSFSNDRLLFVLYLTSSNVGDRKQLISFIRGIFDASYCLEHKFSIFNSLQNLVRNTVAKRPFLGMMNHRVAGINQDFIRNLYDSLSLELVSFWRSISSPNQTIINKEVVRKILFVVRDFSPLYFNTGTKLILDYAYFMVKENHNLRVEILKTYDHYIDASSKVFGAFICHEADIKDLMQKYQFDDYLAFERITLNKTERLPSQNNYFEKLLDKICEFDPDCIVTSEYTLWPLGDALYEKFPLIYLPLQNGAKPLFNYDIILKSLGEINSSNMKFDSRVRQHQYLYIPFPYKKSYSLEKVKSCPKDVALVSVGVDIDIRVLKSEWSLYLEKMVQVLSKKENVYWTIVGIKKYNTHNFISINKYILNFFNKNRVRIVEFEQDLRALMKISDIYILPNFVGGGRGTSLAAWEGLPILVFAGNDADNFIPKECVFETYDSYFEKLEILIEDTEYRDYISNKVRDSFNSNSLKASTQEFLSFCDEAISHFQARQSSNVLDGSDEFF